MKPYEELSISVLCWQCEDIVCTSDGIWKDFEDPNVDDDGWTNEGLIP